MPTLGHVSVLDPPTADSHGRYLQRASGLLRYDLGALLPEGDTGWRLPPVA